MKNDDKVLNSRLEALRDVRWVIVENDDETLSHLESAQLAAEGGDGAEEELTLEEMWDWCVNYEEEPSA
jgi:hypothetical protein